MRLNVEVMGSGDPVTVFAHGLSGSIADTAPLADRVAGTRVLFDFRGHGRSDSPASGYDFRGYADDLRAVSGAHRATAAVGISIGAGAICSLLCEDPKRFSRVVLMMPPASDEMPPLDREGLELSAWLLEEKSLDDVADRLVTDLSSALGERPALLEMLRARVHRMNTSGVPLALRAYADTKPPVTDARMMARFSGASLILAHRNDPAHPVSAAERLAEILPRASLRVWARPLGMYDDPGSLSEIVAEFLGQEGLSLAAMNPSM